MWRLAQVNLAIAVESALYKPTQRSGRASMAEPDCTCQFVMSLQTAGTVVFCGGSGRLQRQGGRH